MPAWLSSGTRQRTKRLEKSALEGDTRIDDSSGGSPLTIEIGAEFPIGINPQTLFPADHQAPPPEIRQVAGYRRLRQLQRIMQMAYADLTGRQQMQQPEAYRIGNGLE